MNPGISLESWPLLINSHTPRFLNSEQGMRIPSLDPQKLVQMPFFFHKPIDHLDEIKSTYHSMSTDLLRLREYLAHLGREVDSAVALHGSVYNNQVNLLHRHQIIYAVLLTIAIALNSLLRTLYGNSDALLKAVAAMTKEFIKLAKRVSKYRPLGAGYIPPCLAAVVSASKAFSKESSTLVNTEQWATTDALPAQRAELERLMTEYQPDFPEIKWMEQAVWLQESHKVLRGTLFGLIPDSPTGEFVEMLNISMVHCKAAFGASSGCLFV